MPKRERILTSAIELFTEFGYANTKIIDIASKANIGKGTIYEYFKSKDEIALNCIKYMVEYYNKGFSDIMSSEQPFKEKITNYLTHTKNLFLQTNLSLSELDNIGPKNHKECEQIMIKEQEFLNKMLIEVLENAVLSKEIRPDINISTISYFVQISIMHMTVSETLFKDEFFSVEDIINLIFNGIGC